MNFNTLHVAPILFAGVLVIWGMYRRVRRSVGLQPLVRRRLRARVVLFIVVAALLLLHAFVSLESAVSDAVGIVLGVIFGMVAIRTTSFERKGEALFYRPNPWIGMTLVVLLVGRIAYRFAVVFPHLHQIEAQQRSAASGGQIQMASYTADPLIGGLFYILCGYYIIYYVWLLRRYTSYKNIS